MKLTSNIENCNDNAGTVRDISLDTDVVGTTPRHHTHRRMVLLKGECGARAMLISVGERYKNPPSRDNSACNS